MSTDTKTTETWLYAGKRADAKGKLFECWVDETDAELHFRGVTGSVPGHAYAVETKRDGDAISVVGTPRYLAEQTDRRATDAQLDRWRAEHAAAKATVEGQLAEKRAKGDDELDAAIEVLRRHSAKLRSHAKTAAFQMYVLGEMQRAPKKDTKGEWD